MYERYKILKTFDEYFSEWEKKSLSQVSPNLKKLIYDKYFVKTLVFQRAKFKCENKNCKTDKDKLTLHHIKFQKNNGKTSVKNGACICLTCHRNFHSGKHALTINDITYKLHVEDEINWKQIRSETKKLRKNNKEFHGYKITWEMLEQLMKFLDIDYNDYDDDTEVSERPLLMNVDINNT